MCYVVRKLHSHTPGQNKIFFGIRKEVTKVVQLFVLANPDAKSPVASFVWLTHSENDYPPRKSRNMRNNNPRLLS
jgi:hypothetical protein